MAKRIQFEYKEKTYTLQFTRSVVEKMEEDGFDVTEVQSKPVTMIPKLFRYSFLAKQQGVDPNLTDEILSNLEDKSGLIEQLSVMYLETVNTLFGEPSKNAIKWKKLN